MSEKASKILLWISGAGTALICLIMNFILIPEIESSTNGIRCFDMNFAYSYETAKKFLSLLSQEGRNVYLNVQLPLDFIYPIFYCVFFSLLIIKLCGKISFCTFPLLLAVLDYAENVCTIIMLKAETLSPAIVSFASKITTLKTILLYLLILNFIILIIKRIIVKKKSSND